MPASSCPATSIEPDVLGYTPIRRRFGLVHDTTAGARASEAFAAGEHAAGHEASAKARLLRAWAGRSGAGRRFDACTAQRRSFAFTAMTLAGRPVSGRFFAVLDDAAQAVRVVERARGAVVSQDRRRDVESRCRVWKTAAEHVQRIIAVGLAVARDPFLDVAAEVQDAVGAGAARKRVDRARSRDSRPCHRAD